MTAVKTENTGLAYDYRCADCKAKATRVNANPQIRTTVMILHVNHSTWCPLLKWKREFMHLDENDLYLPSFPIDSKVREEPELIHPYLD